MFYGRLTLNECLFFWLSDIIYAGHSNPQKDVLRKAVCSKTQRKTKNEMAG
jgi:hypothetical protein